LCTNNRVVLYHDSYTIVLKRCSLKWCTYCKGIFIVAISSQFYNVSFYINYFHSLRCHLNIVLPKWMNPIKIIHCDCITFIPLNVFFNYESTIASVIMSRYILSILETYMIRRVKYNLSI